MRCPAFLVVLAIGCAAPPPPKPLPPKPQERSSLDVLLRHRGELGLTDEQVARLEQLDDARESEVASIREQLKPAPKEERSPPTGGLGSQTPAGMGNAASRGGGRGMGGMGMGRGGGAAAGKPQQDLERLDRLRMKIDDADTRAFIDAQTQVLAPAQRGPAEKLASAYRAQLYDFNAALKAREVR